MMPLVMDAPFKGTVKTSVVQLMTECEESQANMPRIPRTVEWMATEKVV
jgi:hypothetical protein